ncbi:MAG: flavodoxin family protein [Eubacterium sp.]
MNIVMINGQNHKGSTYNIGKMLADKLDGKITEFFLPKDFDQFCIGCTTCFGKDETMCPHYDKLKSITEALDKADVLIFTSPVYVYHCTGSMKAFLDHYGYRWMVHRPEESMFAKQAVCIATAAGAGMKSAIKDMADSMFFWGIAKVYKYGVAVREVSYENVSDKIKRKIDRKTTVLAQKIQKCNGKVKPGIKTKGFFFIMRIAQKSGWNKIDSEYWKSKGWVGNKRPWK